MMVTQIMSVIDVIELRLNSVEDTKFSLDSLAKRLKHAVYTYMHVTKYFIFNEHAAFEE